MPACYNELRRGKHIMRKLATKITGTIEDKALLSKVYKK